MDWPIPRLVSKAPDRKSRVTKGLDSATWSNSHLHSDSSCWLPICTEATVVSALQKSTSSFWFTHLNRFIPPHLDRERSNIENSENTTLFLVSCYEYILSGIVLSIGPPFRQSMSTNREATFIFLYLLCIAHISAVPFVVTIVVALLFSTYMLFDPSKWVAQFMQLTWMSPDFRSFILVLGIGYIAISWTSEQYLLPRFAKYIGMLKTSITRKPKQRKQYKLVLEEMRTLQ